MTEPRDRIVDLDGAAPAPPPTWRDRALIGALTAGCIAIGLVVLVARAPQPLGSVVSPGAPATPSVAPPPRLILDRPDLVPRDGVEFRCWQIQGSGTTTTTARVCVHTPAGDTAPITIEPGNVLPWESSMPRGASPPVLIPPTRP